MKLLRVGPPGQETPALLDAAGTLRSLAGHVADIGGDTLAPGTLRTLAALDPAGLPALPDDTRVGPCIALPRNFVCIGLNYADHAAETGSPVPTEPIVFLKALSAFCGPHDDLILPRGSLKTDWEVELAVVIGTRASYVEEADAMAHVAGYCVVNDISERAYQMERGGTWDKGKGCDTFGPTGPWMVTADEVPDPQDLALFADVDGVRMQDGTTQTMVFGVRILVSYVSRFITLHPGDIISTGTPPGVGMGKKPPQFLRPGQSMRCGIAGLGEQVQRVTGG